MTRTRQHKRLIHLFIVVAASALWFGGRASGQPICSNAEKMKLVPAEDLHYASGYGDAVDMTPDVAVIGASGAVAPDGTHPGAAFVFRRNGDDWVEEQRLVASDAHDGHRFGVHVAISADSSVIAVGTYDQPKVYIFTYDGSSYVETQILSPDDGGSGRWGRARMTIEGNKFFIVDPYHRGEIDEDRVGSLYIFEHDGTSWVQSQQLFSSQQGEDHWFGTSLAADGDTLVVGSVFDNWEAVEGLVETFTFDGTQWTMTQPALSPPADAAWLWGGWLAVHNDTLAIGGPSCGESCLGFWEFPGGPPGVWVYRATDAGWDLRSKVHDPNHTPPDSYGFGTAIAIRNKTLIVGEGAGCNWGQLHIFDRENESGSSWELKGSVTAGEELTWFVQLGGNQTVMTDGYVLSSGFLFKDLEVCEAGCAADLDESGDVGLGDIQHVLDAWGNEGGREDLDGCGAVDFADVIVVLTAWGPCE